MDMAGAGSHIFPERVRRKEDQESSHGLPIFQQDHCNYKLKIIRINNQSYFMFKTHKVILKFYNFY